MPITLRQNPMRDVLQRVFDRLSVRPALVDG